VQILICELHKYINIYKTILGDRIESPTEKIEEILVHLDLLIFTIICMFVSNYAGQEIIDYNNHIFFIV